MKIWKNALMLSVIASMLLSTFAIAPSRALTTMLTVDNVDDTSLVPGSNFSVIVWVVDVEAMFGYNFILGYDTNVLTATGWMPYYPFEYMYDEGTYIDDANGEVHMAYTYPPQPPEEVGWYWEGPYPLVTIDFTVDDFGASLLTFVADPYTVITDIYGNYIVHTAIGGWFRNVAGAPIAGFTYEPSAPMEGETVTFTSTSMDPEGTIAAYAWSFGANTAVATTSFAAGTHTVTLTVTDNDGNIDSFFDIVEVLPAPPLGAIATKGHPSQKHLNFNKYGSHKQILKGWAMNIDPTQTALVRVDLDVWSSNYGHVGAVQPPFQWLAPGQETLFQGELDYLAAKWMFVGGRATMDEFTVIVTVYYADYFYGGDINNPHWAQVEDAPEVSYTFTASEKAPVPISIVNGVDLTGYEYGDPLYYPFSGTTVTFDGSQSYDPDEKWGDWIQYHSWLVYDDVTGDIPVYAFAETYTAELYVGVFWVRHRVEDMFGVRRNDYFTFELTG